MNKWLKMIFSPALLGLVVLTGFSSVSHAEGGNFEFPIRDTSSRECTSISTSAYTAVHASNMAGRTGFFVAIATAASANMVCSLPDTTEGVPSFSAGSEMIITRNSTTWVPGSDKQTFYCASLHTSAEILCTRQGRQTP